MVISAEEIRKRIQRAKSVVGQNFPSDIVVDPDRDDAIDSGNISDRLFGNPFKPLDNAPVGGGRVTFKDGTAFARGPVARGVKGRGVVEEGFRDTNRPLADPSSVSSQLTDLRTGEGAITVGGRTVLSRPTDTIDPDFRQELKEISEGAKKRKLAGGLDNLKKRLTNEDKNRIRLEERENIANEDDPEEKKNIRRRMEARVIGATTEHMDLRKRIQGRTFAIIATEEGVVDPSDIEEIRKTIPTLTRNLTRAKRDFVSGKQVDSIFTKKAYDQALADVRQAVKAQGGELKRQRTAEETRAKLKDTLAREAGERAKTRETRAGKEVLAVQQRHNDRMAAQESAANIRHTQFTKTHNVALRRIEIAEQSVGLAKDAKDSVNKKKAALEIVNDAIDQIDADIKKLEDKATKINDSLPGLKRTRDRFLDDNGDVLKGKDQKTGLPFWRLHAEENNIVTEKEDELSRINSTLSDAAGIPEAPGTAFGLRTKRKELIGRRSRIQGGEPQTIEDIVTKDAADSAERKGIINTDPTDKPVRLSRKQEDAWGVEWRKNNKGKGSKEFYSAFKTIFGYDPRVKE